MARLNRIWWCNTISFAGKFKLYEPLVTSILLYGCETWTLLTDFGKKKRKEKKIQMFETKCLRKLLRISYVEHRTNDLVRSKINFLVGPQEPLLANVKRRKLTWLGHVLRQDSLSKTIIHGTLEGGRRRDRQRKCWMDNIKVWTSLPMPERLTGASCRKKRLEGISAESSFMSPRRPNRSNERKNLKWFSFSGAGTSPDCSERIDILHVLCTGLSVMACLGFVCLLACWGLVVNCFLVCRPLV